MRNSMILLLGAASGLSIYPHAAAAQTAPPPAATVAPDAGAAPEAVVPEPANADPRDSGSLSSDIVITAQRRNESLQRVGIAVTAVTGAQIQALGLTSSIDIAKIASNVSVSGSYGGQMSQFAIRGVTQNDFNDHVESVIAVYVDDAYVASQQGQTFGMFDLERVEVLKGPQGTLFGRNATGGVVNFITKRPTSKPEAFIDATYGSYNNVRVEGALSGPLAGGFNARLSGMFERYDGWIRNKYPEQTFVPAAHQGGLNGVTLPGSGADLGGVKSNWAVRGQIEGALSDTVDLWASAYINKSIASTGPYQQTPTVRVLDAAGNQVNTIAVTATQICQVIQAGRCVHGEYAPGTGATRPVAGGDFYGYRDPDGSGPITSSDYAFDDANTFETYGGTVRLTANLGGATLTSLSDYKHFDKDFSLDLEAGPENQFFWHGVSKSKTFSQELRVNGDAGRFRYIAGGYFLVIDNRSDHGIGALPDSSYAVTSWDQPRIVDLNTKSYSLFGQVEYKAADTFSLIGGLRWSREVKDYGFEVLFVSPTTGLDPKHFDYSPSVVFPGFSQALYTADNAETLWSFKAQANWTPTDRLLFYAGVTQGAKAGSYNAGGPPLAAVDIPYKPEKLVSYEVGMKSSLFDRRLRFNAAAFYYDYTNYQASRWLGFSSLIINADARIYGAEAEMVASLSDNLEASFNAGYQNNKVKDVPVAGVLRDVHTTFTPAVTLSGTLRYKVPVVVAGGNVAVQGDATYQSKVWHNLNNFDVNQLDAWGIVNGRIDWMAPDSRLRVSFFVRNIFNKHYDTVGFDLSQICGCNLMAQGKPRWLGLQVRRDF